MKAARVADHLARKDVSFALIGGFAVIARGRPRFTRDYDFATVDTQVLQRQFWLDLGDASVDIRRADFDDPLRGVVRIVLSDATRVDVVVLKFQWQHRVIERAEILDLGGIALPVPRTSDVILLKLFAAGGIDRTDVYELLHLPDREAIVAEVNEHIVELPEDAQQLWRTILATEG